MVERKGEGQGKRGPNQQTLQYISIQQSAYAVGSNGMQGRADHRVGGNDDNDKINKRSIWQGWKG